jgi:CheY-like chemotaxis protein
MTPHAEPPPPPFPNATTCQRILIVDDNDDARMLLAEILQSLGHDVSTAPDGDAALVMVRERIPDIAILDIGLPTMDGYELAAKLRDELVAPPVLIALTGYGQPQDRARGETAGFDRFLVKPIDVRNLLSTIDAVAVAHRA